MSATRVGDTMAGSRPAVFLDRDGVINENISGSYVHTWEQFHFLPGAAESVAALKRAGLPVVVVTNQAGIGRGHMQEAALLDIHTRMQAELALGGGTVDAVLYCPHAQEAGCDCRKPQPGLLRRAARQLDLDLGRSYFVGDHLTDVQAGLAAGCQPILVRTGRGAEVEVLLATDPRYAGVPVVDDLPAAVTLILSQLRSAPASPCRPRSTLPS